MGTHFVKLPMIGVGYGRVVWRVCLYPQLSIFVDIAWPGLALWAVPHLYAPSTACWNWKGTH